jgi:hypothetical protein
LGKANIDHARVLPQILVEVKEDLTFKVKPMKILDWGGERELHNKRILIVRIL